MNSVSDDNAIATALIASMHRAGVINRRCNSPERLEAVDLHLQNGLVLAKLGMTTAVEK
jgi:hypothetical protein